jgi:hypothetical protein
MCDILKLLFSYMVNIQSTYGLHTFNIWALTVYMSIVGFELWFPKLETKFLPTTQLFFL